VYIQTLVCITTRGVLYSVRGFQIPQASRTAKGVPMPQVLPITADEKVTSVIPVDSFKEEDDSLVLMSSKGFIVKTPLKEFKKITGRGLKVMALGEGDSLRWARRCSPDEDVLVATRKGFGECMSSFARRTTKQFVTLEPVI
jgi:DNA gyrase subunit A